MVLCTTFLLRGANEASCVDPASFLGTSSSTSLTLLRRCSVVFAASEFNLHPQFSA